MSFITDKKDNFYKVYYNSIDNISEETQIRYEGIYINSHFRNLLIIF